MKFDIRPFIPVHRENPAGQRTGRYAQLRKKQDMRITIQLQSILKPARKRDRVKKHICNTTVPFINAPVDEKPFIYPGWKAWEKQKTSRKRGAKAA